MKARADMEALVSAGLVRDLFNYDKQTGVFTHKKSVNQIEIGSRAGHLENSGYRRITINGRRYQEHRVAWLWMTGAWPKDRIDHRNTIKSDNRWENLRPANNAENSANRKVRSHSKLGIKGVRLHESGRYQARIFIQKRHKSLGLFDTADEAKAAYLTAAKSVFGDFARG